ncbi:MAG: 2-amino-4-hydroxy-6-hydroxymethyldihydropteridine diphosphokinase [Candidatus Omnitrophota bacterium]|jgi:2-amino-4-hydroxy-6-hydroxymethyldihydropteridine diphosphokinase|nr:MAG: 2-amino-4-hydroxy-6-hydroxymethyldihydropteridine diphosphokinase [Candidatus Omnitrophota bacterium]
MLAYISMGSNLGNRGEIIKTAMVSLSHTAGVTVLRQSPLYETKPVGLPDGAPMFLNGAAELEAHCSARELLRMLLDIELLLGRVRSPSLRYESRTIDLDLLLFGNEIIDETGLQIPHPRMRERWFVLKPLSDICPDRVIPGLNVTVSQALQCLESKAAISVAGPVDP